MEKIIDMAVLAGRLAAQRAPADAYKATERRLYALPILREKQEYDRERLPSLRDTARADLEERMTEDAAEIAALERALANCAGDTYYQAMTGRYLDGLKDEYLAKLLHCDAITVGRHRKRLVQKVSVWLYGAAAVR